MRRLVPGRRAVGIALLTLVLLALGVTAGVSVARPATTAATSSTTTTTALPIPGQSTTTTTATDTSTTSTSSTAPLDPNPAAAKYFVFNGTANAASDHEIVGSTAFPNYTTGAIDNYYSMAHSHVDNSPFAEGRASPADTGPVGQTAAAGNFQQPQYADARWPGSSGTGTYGTKGQPYAAANASDDKATAEASEAASSLSGTGNSSSIAVPKGFDGRLRQALAAWKAKWQGRLHPKAPTVKTPTVKTPTVKTPTVKTPTVRTPTIKAPAVTPPAVTVTTPVATVSTPSVSLGSLTTPAPVTVPSADSQPGLTPKSAAPSRSLESAPADGASLLSSSTLATLDPTSGALVTSGESSLGRVSVGGGQIVIDGIHVTASLTNDGTTPADKVDISVAAASIGGVPVTIDQDGVHVAGQSQGLPYQQASDALNTALQQAGVKVFLVSPELTTSCGDSGLGTSNGTTSTPTTTDSGSGSGGCGDTGTTSCGDSGTTTTSPLGGLGTTPTTTSGGDTGTTTTTSSCGDTGTTTTTSSCDTGAGTGGTGTGYTSTNSTTSSTTTTSSCGDTGTFGTTTGTCSGSAATTTGTTDTTTTATTTTTPTTTDWSGPGTTGTSGMSGSGEETLTATGVHLLFTQPVQQSGVPAQSAEHILGEVFLDSLATPAGQLPDLGLNLDLNSNSTSSGNPCGLEGKKSGGKKTSAAAATGGGGSTGSGSTSGASGTSLQPVSGAAGGVGSQPGYGSTGTMQPASSSTGGSLPAVLASALRKPLWLVLAYLLWQALVIVTGASLWSWRRDGAS